MPLHLRLASLAVEENGVRRIARRPLLRVDVRRITCVRDALLRA